MLSSSFLIAVDAIAAGGKDKSTVIFPVICAVWSPDILHITVPFWSVWAIHEQILINFFQELGPKAGFRRSIKLANFLGVV